MSLGSHLKRLTESHAPRDVVRLFGEAIAEKKIDPYKVHLQDLAESFLGRDTTDKVRKLMALRHDAVNLLEASEAVDASTFSNITGQLLVTIIKEKYDAPEFIGDQLMKTYPNPGGNLQTHKIPGLSNVLNKGTDKLQQKEPYPQTSFSETWVTMPAPEKRGEICAVAMEMVLSDQTGQAQDSAASVGTAARYGKEERQLKTVLGLESTWLWNGNSVTTYLATAGTGNYANMLASTTISTYVHINSVEQLFWKMVDPITSRRIMARPTSILCMPSKRYDLKRILHATEVRDATSALHNVSANPLDTTYPILTSPIAEQLLLDSGVSAANTKERVYFGDWQKAFGYREVYPVQITPAPVNNPMEFDQDIVLAIKVSEFGVPFVYDPHYAVLCKAEA